MAAPAAALHKSFGFRDAKGNTSRMRVLLGAADVATIYTNTNTMATHLAAVSNASISTSEQAIIPHTLGTSAEYDTCEDGAVLTFSDPAGQLHRYKVPAPKSTMFSADQETVDSSVVAVSNLIGDFTSGAYGRSTDTAALTYVGGIRVRAKMKRKYTIWSRNPALTGPGL
jgi:hypothetical protein